MRYLILAIFLAACAREEQLRLELTEIGSPATTGAAEPNLSADAEGNVYLSWIQRGRDSTHALQYAVLQQGKLGLTRTIAFGRDWFVNWADFPMLTRLPSGEMAAHWLERNGPGKYAYGVRIALWNDDVTLTPQPVTPHRDPSEAEHGFVTLFPENKKVGVIWLDGRQYAQAKASNDSTLEEMQLRYTTIGVDGKLSDDQLIDDRTCDCCQTTVALTDRGPLVAYRNRTDDEIRDIYVARLENGKWTEGKPVHNDNWKVNFCPVNGPMLEARGNNVVIAWFSAADSVPRVNVAFSSDAGDTFSDPIRVDQGAPKGRVDVAWIDHNSALVSWLEAGQFMVRKVKRSGRMSTPFAIATMSEQRAGGFPRMAATEKEVVFAWTVANDPKNTSIRLSRALLR
jgi:hypothetical protein